jgi:hypothetical protein
VLRPSISENQNCMPVPPRPSTQGGENWTRLVDDIHHIAQRHRHDGSCRHSLFLHDHLLSHTRAKRTTTPNGDCTQRLPRTQKKPLLPATGDSAVTRFEERHSLDCVLWELCLVQLPRL